MSSVLEILNSKMPTPEAYGWFHILCLIITAALTVLAVIRGPKLSEQSVRRIVFLTALSVALLEVYKQINFTFGSGDCAPEYAWYAFPFQFCSTPMYVGLLTGFFRKGKLHDALCAYLCSYAPFAGAAVMLCPGDVFVGTIGINIQTMVCHGSMLPIAALLLSSGHVKLERKTLLRALAVFLSCVGIACVMNETAYRVGLLAQHEFNMFYISPHCEPHLFLYCDVQRLLPFPIDLLVYILTFTAAAAAILLLAAGMRRIQERTLTA